jgi:hypothetical protein
MFGPIEALTSSPWHWLSGNVWSFSPHLPTSPPGFHLIYHDTHFLTDYRLRSLAFSAREDESLAA